MGPFSTILLVRPVQLRLVLAVGWDVPPSLSRPVPLDPVGYRTFNIRTLPPHRGSFLSGPLVEYSVCTPRSSGFGSESHGHPSRDSEFCSEPFVVRHSKWTSGLRTDHLRLSCDFLKREGVRECLQISHGKTYQSPRIRRYFTRRMLSLSKRVDTSGPGVIVPHPVRCLRGVMSEVPTTLYDPTYKFTPDDPRVPRDDV